jgi:hypothetical protein
MFEIGRYLVPNNHNKPMFDPNCKIWITGSNGLLSVWLRLIYTNVLSIPPRPLPPLPRVPDGDPTTNVGTLQPLSLEWIFWT